jgi:endonuclease YncB( thermonuclease family)
MQVYVHRGGEQLGPYGIEQLRQQLEAGELSLQDKAFYKGASGWVPLTEVPGFAEESAETTAKSPPTPAKNKLRWLTGGVVILTAAIVTGVILLPGDEPTQPVSTTDGQADRFILQPSDVVSVYDGDTFKVDLEGVHPLFGDDVSVRINGIDTPEIKGESEQVEALAREARDFVEATLKGASQIELRNLQRGKYFRIVADVYVNGQLLADALREKGLAKDYDGKGPKPTW